MTLTTVVLLTLFVGLGHWQWQRGADKEATWAQFGRDARATDLGSRELDAVDLFSRVALSGHFEPAHQFVLDNRSHGGMPGFEILTPFVLLDGRRVLVDRGWVPFSGYRERMPDVSMKLHEEIRISGRVSELPSGGLASGHAAPEASGAWPRLTSFPTHAELETALGQKLQRRILLLDAASAEGYVRQWSPPGLAPERHFSYAIQWWGFAVVLLVLYFGLNFRKVN